MNTYVYTIDGDATTSNAINFVAKMVAATPDADRLRTDRLRWTEKVNGEFKIPVVTIHPWGDLFVPANVQQVYQKRVAAKGINS